MEKWPAAKENEENPSSRYQSLSTNNFPFLKMYKSVFLFRIEEKLSFPTYMISKIKEKSFLNK